MWHPSPLVFPIKGGGPHLGGWFFWGFLGLSSLSLSLMPSPLRGGSLVLCLSGSVHSFVDMSLCARRLGGSWFECHRGCSRVAHSVSESPPVLWS